MPRLFSEREAHALRPDESIVEEDLGSRTGQRIEFIPNDTDASIETPGDEHHCADRSEGKQDATDAIRARWRLTRCSTPPEHHHQDPDSGRAENQEGYENGRTQRG